MYRKIMKEDKATQTLLGLEKLCSRELYEHSIKVAKLTTKMLDAYEDLYSDAEPLKAQEKSIINGALLHDIGKIFLPFNLTDMPRKLEDEEMGIIKSHAYIGYEILKESFDEVVCNIAKMHHEKPNGSGYPNRMKQVHIPEYVMLVQCADVFDALHSKRVYKKAFGIQTSLKIMQEDAYNFLLDDKYLNLLQAVL